MRLRAMCELLVCRNRRQKTTDLCHADFISTTRYCDKIRLTTHHKLSFKLPVSALFRISIQPHKDVAVQTTKHAMHSIL